MYFRWERESVDLISQRNPSLIPDHRSLWGQMHWILNVPVVGCTHWRELGGLTVQGIKWVWRRSFKGKQDFLESFPSGSLFTDHNLTRPHHHLLAPIKPGLFYKPWKCKLHEHQMLLVWDLTQKRNYFVGGGFLALICAISKRPFFFILQLRLWPLEGAAASAVRHTDRQAPHSRPYDDWVWFYSESLRSINRSLIQSALSWLER